MTYGMAYMYMDMEQYTFTRKQKATGRRKKHIPITVFATTIMPQEICYSTIQRGSLFSSSNAVLESGKQHEIMTKCQN